MKEKSQKTLLNKIRAIYDGWKNDLIGVPDEHKPEAERRALICAECPNNIDNKCELCGCPLSKKTKSFKGENQCPENRW